MIQPITIFYLAVIFQVSYLLVYFTSSNVNIIPSYFEGDDANGFLPPSYDNDTQQKQQQKQQQTPPVGERRTNDDNGTQQKQQQTPPVGERRTNDDNGTQQKQQQTPPVGERMTNGDNDSHNTTQKMNILLLYADDWRHDVLGSAGHPVVKTPVFDRLAREGIRFTHNCVTTSVCWISRVSFYTGQYMSRHKTVILNDTTIYDMWNNTFPGLLRANGYHVGIVGKWHLNQSPMMNATFFDFQRLYYGRHMMKTNKNSTQFMHVTDKNQKDAFQFLRERPRNKPFCLTVSFFATHAEDANPAQYIPQKRSMARYHNVTVPRAVTHSDAAWRKLPHFFVRKNAGRRRYFWRHDTPEKHSKMMTNLYRMATEVDTASGNILKLLEKQGVLNNTLVIFTTDNGLFMGEHGLADKWYPHEESIRVPLIVRDPRMDKEWIGRVNDELTLNVDVAPTVLGAAGVSVPEGMQGRDMADLYVKEKTMRGGGGGNDTGGHEDEEDNGGGEERNATTMSRAVGNITNATNSTTSQHGNINWRQEFFYEHPMMGRKNVIPASEALVRKNFKYFYWPDFDFEQLFNMETDPYEQNDVKDDPRYKDVMEDMRRRFAELKPLAS